MSQPDPTWTDIAQVGLVAAQLVVLVVAAIYAKRQVAEATRLREEQSRPFVVIDFHVQNRHIYLVVTNTGNSLARDVRFELQPALESTFTKSDDGLTGPEGLKMLTDGIPTLAPGKELRTLFDLFPTRESEGLRDTYRAAVHYKDESGRRSFTEEMDLDIGIYRNMVSVSRKDVHDVHRVLDRMLGEMKHWRGSGNRGLLTMSPDQKRTEGKRRQRDFEKAKQRPPFAAPPSGLRARMVGLIPPWLRRP